MASFYLGFNSFDCFLISLCDDHVSIHRRTALPVNATLGIYYNSNRVTLPEAVGKWLGRRSCQLAPLLTGIRTGQSRAQPKKLSVPEVRPTLFAPFFPVPSSLVAFPG